MILQYFGDSEEARATDFMATIASPAPVWQPGPEQRVLRLTFTTMHSATVRLQHSTASCVRGAWNHSRPPTRVTRHSPAVDTRPELHVC